MEARNRVNAPHLGTVPCDQVMLAANREAGRHAYFRSRSSVPGDGAIIWGDQWA